jgi:hypothetical protein
MSYAYNLMARRILFLSPFGGVVGDRSSCGCDGGHCGGEDNYKSYYYYYYYYYYYHHHYYNADKDERTNIFLLFKISVGHYLAQHGELKI